MTRFKKGDRVAALSVYLRTQIPAHAAFQLYTFVPEYLVSRIPDTLSPAQACVLPLGLATAAAGLYQPEYLGLAPPTSHWDKYGGKEKAILIWGGSSTVGSCCIQLCVASGLTVLTTASSKNRDYVKDLGAHYVFDHADDNVVKQLSDAVAGKVVVGAYDTISSKGTALKCAEFLHAVGGGKLFATRPSEFAPEVILFDNVRRIAGKSSLFRKVDRLLIRIGHPPGSLEGGERPLWMKIWVDFMSERLETGTFRAKPEPIVLEGGLEKLQDAMDLYRKGVSAAKIIVLL